MTGVQSVRLETLRVWQECLTGGLIQLVGEGSGVRGGFLEVVALNLKGMPKGKGEERKGTDGQEWGGGFTQSLTLLEGRDPALIIFTCPGTWRTWDKCFLASQTPVIS